MGILLQTLIRGIFYEENEIPSRGGARLLSSKIYFICSFCNVPQAGLLYADIRISIFQLKTVNSNFLRLNRYMLVRKLHTLYLGQLKSRRSQL